MRPEGEFAIAREMQRLREEVADLKARLKEAKDEINGRKYTTTIDRLAISGQARTIVCALAAASPSFVSTERLAELCGMEGEWSLTQVRQVVDRLRDKMTGLMSCDGIKPPTRLLIIRGSYGMGYSVPPDVKNWLTKPHKSGGFDVSRSS